MNDFRDSKKILLEVYHRLLSQIGPRGWWPAESPFEVIIGAILTQNTAWANVKKAITNLKEKGVLSVQGLHQLDLKSLAQLVRPSGYYNQKAKKIKYFVDYLVRGYNGSLDKLAQVDTDTLRRELLSINGIGRETADSILLYALEKPSFVVDAYTKRILSRHGLMDEEAKYEEVRGFFMDNLPQNVQLFNEFHALIDYVGHYYCKKVPQCHLCPLEIFLESSESIPIKEQGN